MLFRSPDRWDDLERIFGPNGANSGCWCMWFRRPRKEWQAAHSKGNRAALKKLVDDEALGMDKAKRMLIHAIAADDVMRAHSVASKLNADWDFLSGLRDSGRKYATEWLDRNFDRLGVESSVDIRTKYL